MVILTMMMIFYCEFNIIINLMDLIIDNLYLGDIQGASNMAYLKRHVNFDVLNLYRE